jgi:hypothetical protein
MQDSLKLLDKAMELGREELDLLDAGELDAAGDIARERGELLAQAWKLRDDASLDELQRKLVQMQSLQGRLTDHARSLHAKLKEELRRTREEDRRLAGYGSSVRPKSPYSRFVSKHG